MIAMVTTSTKTWKPTIQRMAGELATKQITTMAEAATRKPEEMRQYFHAAKAKLARSKRPTAMAKNSSIRLNRYSDAILRSSS